MKYAIRILELKFWELENLKEACNLSIIKNGPNQFDCDSLQFALENIKDIQEALTKLKS